MFVVRASSMSSCSFTYLGHHSRFYYFSKVQHLPYAILLDSGAHFSKDQHKKKINDYSRFDIILARPEKVLLKEEEKLYILDDQLDKTLLNDKDFFSRLQSWLTHYTKTQIQQNHPLPFNGGLCGVLGYDFNQPSSSTSTDNKPVESKQDYWLPSSAIGLYLSALIIDHAQESVTLYSFSTQQDNFEQLQQDFQNREDKTIEKETFQLTSDWNSNLDEQAYRDQFERVKHYILSGDAYQINLAQRFQAEFEGAPWSAYQYLSDINQGPFSAYMNCGNWQILSLSPERFINIQNNQVSTQPIKGTRPRSKDADTDKQLANELKQSTKDKAENLMIVDLLRNDLGKTALTGSVKVTELFGHYRFPAVHHLISTIISEISPKTQPLEVLKHAFPGGSITGAPKIRAMQIIEECEPHSRHIYCGSMVYIDFNRQMDSSILIRSLLTHNDRIYTWSGGGIVYDSDCEEEYQETFSKLSNILPILKKLHNLSWG